MKKNYTTALFDVDGTLVTLDGVVKAIQETLTHFDLSAMSHHDVIHHFIGHVLIDAFPRVYPHMAAEADAMQKFYTWVFLRRHKEFEKLQPHVCEVLQTIKDNGLKIGIITTKGRKEALAVLAAYNLPYDLLVSHNDVSAIKPSPLPIQMALDRFKAKPSEAIMTGDHIFDVMAARSAKVDGAGVLTGASTREELKEAGAVYILKDLSDLLEVMGL
jgi:pyrophosphatase PpaX